MGSKYHTNLEQAGKVGYTKCGVELDFCKQCNLEAMTKKNLHRNGTIRRPGYDYSRAGAYFVTTCTSGRANLFGKIVKNEMRLNVYGRIVQEVWNGLPGHYPHVVLDAFVIMPNHIHGIVVLVDGVDLNDISVGAGFEWGTTGRLSGQFNPRLLPTLNPAHIPRHGLPEIVRAFKTFSARQINQLRHTPGIPVWQRNYYEHIIRNNAALNRIRQYIKANPAHWEKDRENPNGIGKRGFQTHANRKMA